MGQRTAIVLKVDYKNEYTTGEKQTSTAVFYHQWGIGRILLSQVAMILNGIVSTHMDWKDAAHRLKPAGTDDVFDEESEKEKKMLSAVSFDDPESVGKVLRYNDNNNGGCFIHIEYIYTKKHEEQIDVKYAFMLGREEDGDYKSFCSKQTFVEKVGMGYVDEKFLKILDSTLEYWEAKDMGAKESAEDSASVSEPAPESTPVDADTQTTVEAVADEIGTKYADERVYIAKYSEKSFILTGNTKFWHLELKKYGMWHTGKQGWILSNKRRKYIETLIGKQLVAV